MRFDLSIGTKKNHNNNNNNDALKNTEAAEG